MGGAKYRPISNTVAFKISPILNSGLNGSLIASAGKVAIVLEINSALMLQVLSGPPDLPFHIPLHLTHPNVLGRGSSTYPVDIRIALQDSNSQEIIRYAPSPMRILQYCIIYLCLSD